MSSFCLGEQNNQAINVMLAASTLYFLSIISSHFNETIQMHKT